MIFLFSYFGQILATSETSPLPILFPGGSTSFFFFCQTEPWGLIFLIFPVKRSLGLDSQLASFPPFMLSLLTASSSFSQPHLALLTLPFLLLPCHALPNVSHSLSYFNLSVLAPSSSYKIRLLLPTLKGQTNKPWLCSPCHSGADSLFPCCYPLSSLPPAPSRFSCPSTLLKFPLTKNQRWPILEMQ